MSIQVELSGVGDRRLRKRLVAALKASKPEVLGLASAFVSVKGVRHAIEDISRTCGARCFLVAGTSNTITHPEALFEAKRSGWHLRIGNPGSGIFHPKLMVGGARFGSHGRVIDPSFAYVGSSNLTGAGLGGNVECGVLSTGADVPDGTAAAFGDLWRASRPAGKKTLADYSVRFAEENRKRGRSALVDSGVAEPGELTDLSTANIRLRRAPSQHALGETYAITAWAGLESFTGEYTFQVEFPQAAGRVVRRLIAGTGTSVDLECSDGLVRKMMFRFYKDNGMFRLNIPNDVPGVAWAREHHRGVAVVTGDSPHSALRLDIITLSNDLDDTVARSLALGTWGKTPTRLYGWF